MGKNTEVLYREIQRPRLIIWWVLIIAIAVFMWYWFIQQIILGEPIGERPASNSVTIIFWVIFGILFPVLLLGVLRLIIEVRHDGLYIRFIPFHFKYKQFLFKDIEHYKSITFSPMGRFGGWGIRFNFDGETAYTLNGREGIELELSNLTVVVGTQKPNDLKKAMDSAKKAYRAQKTSVE